MVGISLKIRFRSLRVHRPDVEVDPLQGFRDLIGREPDVDGGLGAGGRGGAVDQPRPRSGDQDGLQDLLGLL